MIKRSQVAAARLAVAAAKYQGKEHELSDTTKRLARLNIEDLPRQEAVKRTPPEGRQVKRISSPKGGQNRNLMWQYVTGPSDRCVRSLVRDSSDYKIEAVSLPPEGVRDILLYVEDPEGSQPDVEAYGEAMKAFERGWNQASRLVVLGFDGMPHHAYKRDEEGGKLVEDLNFVYDFNDDSASGHDNGGSQKPRRYWLPG